MDTLSFLCFCSGFFVFLKFSNSTTAITLSESLSDGSTLVSRDRSFELGFFTPGSSSSRYVGIWYKNIPVKTVVWVANRENPINDSSGSLTIDSRGNLVLVGKNKTVFWSTNTTKHAHSPVVELLDSGNLVLRDMEDSSVENYLWQSFDYPTDTSIPGMKVGINLKTGFVRQLIAWKNWDDPSPGYFLFNIQPQNIPQSIIWKGSSIFYRSSPLDGISYRGSTMVTGNPSYSLEYVHNEEEIYCLHHRKSKSIMTRVVMNQTNNRLERFTWNNETQSWILDEFKPAELCDNYALCGANGICTRKLSPCECPRGFKPKFEENWNSGNWSEGCVRNKSLDCSRDGFIKFSGSKLPDATHTWVHQRMDPKQCSAKCLENCSCTAYSTLDVENGDSGSCAIWFNDLVDIKQDSSGRYIVAQDFFVRVSASESDERYSAKTVLSKKRIVVITVTVIVVVSGALFTGYFLHRNKRKVKEKRNEHEEDMDLPLFDLESISNATNKFAATNKLGEGGFGPVYKIVASIPFVKKLDNKITKLRT